MMRFHHTFFAFVIIVLFCAGSAAADEFGDRMAAQLNRNVDAQVAELVSQRLVAEIEALLVPSALPPAGPESFSGPVASATSGRALPAGELTTARLRCAAASDCTMAQGSDAALLAVKGR